jgi:hypothetical protein
MVNKWAEIAAALGLAAALTAVTAGCGNSPSGVSGADAAATTAEHFTATTTNLAIIDSKSETVRLLATGVFTATGTISLGGSSATGELRFRNGDIEVRHGDGVTKQTLDKKDCVLTYTDRNIKYKILGGTGAYKGITGSGTAGLEFALKMPRTSHGSCDTSNSATPKAASEWFVASGPVKLS